MMTKQEKIESIAEILDLEVEDIKEDAVLEEYEEWDSVAILSFIALLDEKFGKAVKGAEIRKLTTVKDLMDMMEE
ncbi:MAG: acyl carrier protein [Lachnospiraceae bacterium]|nr:acyl carrier protein [Lachnospiraceae bacterium]